MTHVDVARGERVIGVLREQISKSVRLIGDEPTKLPQTRYSCLAGDWEAIGSFSYALGAPYDDVREAFAQSARANFKVFELRGTDPAFPVTEIRLDTAGHVVDERPRFPPGTKDYSLTNSKGGLQAVYLALIAKEEELAGKIASLLWDPPEASYIGRKSVVCTFNDMYLAYAVRELLGGNKESVETWLAEISIQQRDEFNLRAQRTMIRAMLSRKLDDFQAGLRELLEWHTRMSKRFEGDSYFYLCVPGLALSKLAVNQGLLDSSQLPEGNVFLPVELILGEG